MKLRFLKIERILKIEKELHFEIPIGGIRLVDDMQIGRNFEEVEFTNDEPITYKLRDEMFYDIMQDVCVLVFRAQEHEPFKELTWTAYSFLTIAEVEQGMRMAAIEDRVFEVSC